MYVHMKAMKPLEKTAYVDPLKPVEFNEGSGMRGGNDQAATYAAIVTSKTRPSLAPSSLTSKRPT